MTHRSTPDHNHALEELVSLYEDGYKDIQSILVDSELTAEEQVDSISDIVFDDETEED